NSLSPELHDQDWYKRADAILAINTGDPTADEKIGRYLHSFPNDCEMILAQVSIWQRLGRISDIRRFLQNLNLRDLSGLPEHRIRIASMIVYYGETSRGLTYAYLVLMDNWDNPHAHLMYQGLIFLNESVGSAMPTGDTVTEDTVV